MTAIISATNPTYVDAEDSAINCLVTFDTIGGPYPYTAVPNDTTDYGVQLWADLNRGVYGAIGPYVVPTPTQPELLQALATYRYSKMTAGITVGGFSVPTDDTTCAKLNAAYVKATLNPAMILTWILPSGPVPLNAAQLIAIGDAVFSYQEACYAAQGTVMTAIASYTTITEVQAAFDAALAATLS